MAEEVIKGYYETWIDETQDEVEHPPHYTSGPMESIDLMLEMEGPEAVKGFCICNCWKYLYRHKAKGGTRDIEKMVWYANKYVELSKRFEED